MDSVTKAVNVPTKTYSISKNQLLIIGILVL